MKLATDEHGFARMILPALAGSSNIRVSSVSIRDPFLFLR
jgi:hypothetical protein